MYFIRLRGPSRQRTRRYGPQRRSTLVALQPAHPQSPQPGSMTALPLLVGQALPYLILQVMLTPVQHAVGSLAGPQPRRAHCGAAADLGHG
jgi:hypothetical protein